jgi:SOS response regulatory protein OraA/RecX
VDDRRFAIARAQELAGRGYGDEAIRFDLAGRGVEGDEAEVAIAELVPEQERAAALVERHGPGRKTAALLARRGFGPDAVEKAAGADVASGAP